ncbi:2-hydroxychromene-2-carboxylate isomerase [Cognatishimia sp. WU-CL00825]
MIGLAKKHSLDLVLKPVYPLAIREPQFFSKGNPALLNYLRTDAERTAAMLGIPFDWPAPDPIVQNLETGEIAQDQPYIRQLTRLLAAACRAGLGVQVYQAVGALLFGQNGSWTRSGALEAAVKSAGGDWFSLNQHAKVHSDRFDELLARNAQELKCAGHWGTPTLLFENEVFFGQDRLEMCDWYISKSSSEI